MNKLLASLTVPLALAAAIVAAPRIAHASSPLGAWADVEKVEYQPDKAAATKIVIHGVFALSTSSSGWSYSSPKRGYMYFQCPAGSESTCRLAWDDLEKGIGTTYCSGYGEMYKPPGTIRDEGTPLGSPDPWVVGTGVMNTPYAGGTCDLLKKVPDPTIGGDAGTDASMDTGTVDTGTEPSKDSGTVPPPVDSGSSGGDAGTGGADTGSGKELSNEGKDQGGCSVAAPGFDAASASGGLFAAVALALAAIRRRKS